MRQASQRKRHNQYVSGTTWNIEGPKLLFIGTALVHYGRTSLPSARVARQICEEVDLDLEVAELNAIIAKFEGVEPVRAHGHAHGVNLGSV